MSERGRREREFAEAEIDLIQTEIKAKNHKPLKPARSEAELTRVRQGWMLISLNCLNVTMTVLILLKTFGII